MGSHCLQERLKRVRPGCSKMKDLPYRMNSCICTSRADSTNRAAKNLDQCFFYFFLYCMAIWLLLPTCELSSIVGTYATQPFRFTIWYSLSLQHQKVSSISPISRLRKSLRIKHAAVASTLPLFEVFLDLAFLPIACSAAEVVYLCHLFYHSLKIKYSTMSTCCFI